MLIEFYFKPRLVSCWFEVVEPSKSTTIEHLPSATKIQMEHLAGIEPVSLAWEAKVLPLNYRCTP